LGTDYTTLAPPRRDTGPSRRAGGNKAILEPTILLCGVLLALACSYSTQPYGSTDKVAVQGVKVAPQSIQLSAIGETKDLSATINPANATDKALSWESTDPAVASVDSNGRVTARAVGSGVLITAFTHDGRHEASATVTVNP
jgi:uncharacterized protein YjdB